MGRPSSAVAPLNLLIAAYLLLLTPSPRASASLLAFAPASSVRQSALTAASGVASSPAYAAAPWRCIRQSRATAARRHAALRPIVTRLSSSNSDGNDATAMVSSPSAKESLEAGESSSANSVIVATATAGFGESVPYVPPPPAGKETFPPSSSPSLFAKQTIEDDNDDNVVAILKKKRLRNVVVAVASFAVAIFNYGWQLAHPVTAVEILATLQKQSAPLTAIGNNGKPTVIDFWAPWCENCRVAAPTLLAVEREYSDRVNFVVIDGDDGRNWPLIQLFGVDAIPHVALLSDTGDVETALIGLTSRGVLKADIEALLRRREDCDEKVEEVVKEAKVCHDELPYKMYDAFGNRPDSRRINFAQR